MTLDARHPHDAIRLGSVNELIEIANAIAERRSAWQCNARGRWINPQLQWMNALPRTLSMQWSRGISA